MIFQTACASSSPYLVELMAADFKKLDAYVPSIHNLRGLQYVFGEINDTISVDEEVQ